MSSLSVANLFGVQGRIALVTGGCSGIGLMIAKVSEGLRSVGVSMNGILKLTQGLVANGAKVYVTALPTDDIDGAVAELQELGKDTGGQAIG
jgi:hypothetical protein